MATMTVCIYEFVALQQYKFYKEHRNVDRYVPISTIAPWVQRACDCVHLLHHEALVSAWMLILLLSEFV